MKYSFTFSLIVFSSIGFGQNTLENCEAFIRNDTLFLKNELTTHSYAWNDGNIIPLFIENKDGTTLYFGKTSTPDFSLGLDFPAGAHENLQTKECRLSALDDPYLEAEIVFSVGTLMVKRVIKIHPKSAMVSHHFLLKGSTNTVWGGMASSSQEMIEMNVSTVASQATVGCMKLKNPHWTAQVVSFEEATDHNNNLVFERRYLAYKKPVSLQGNLLMANNPVEDASLIILKEAPLADSQHGYSGNDFILDQAFIQVVGLGILPQDIKPNFWTRGYGYAIGIAKNNQLARLITLKAYQKAERKLLKERDDMILSNTWGDRSKDGRMNERFILEELDAASKMGITHLQLDDGWQQGLSRNSASKAGEKWDDWEKNDWQIHSERFPNGFESIIATARKKNIEVCLWFNPSKKNSYALWERDADILIEYYKKWGIRVFKIDGIDLIDKQSELHVRRMFDKVLKATGGKVVFNMDVTAGARMGYHYFTEYGNIFLENRYTDWANYYPHLTLRNLWMLSKYVPTERLQIEFLNTWRNVDRYPLVDPLAPSNVPYDYQVATSLMGQPLAWMELSQLPEEAKNGTRLLQDYKKSQHDLHQGIVLPIGNEPDGFNWTGFQSITNQTEGYFLVFREQNNHKRSKIETWLPAEKEVSLIPILGDAIAFQSTTLANGTITFELPEPFSFGLYKYKIVE